MCCCNHDISILNADISILNMDMYKINRIKYIFRIKTKTAFHTEACRGFKKARAKR